MAIFPRFKLKIYMALCTLYIVQLYTYIRKLSLLKTFQIIKLAMAFGQYNVGTEMSSYIPRETLWAWDGGRRVRRIIIPMLKPLETKSQHVVAFNWSHCVCWWQLICNGAKEEQIEQVVNRIWWQFATIVFGVYTFYIYTLCVCYPTRISRVYKW